MIKVFIVIIVLTVLFGLFDNEGAEPSSEARVVDSLLAHLINQKGGINYSAFSAIVEFDDPRIVDRFIELLDDSSCMIRGTVAGALGGMEDPRAVDILIKKLEDLCPFTRMTSASSLGLIADSRAIEPLIELLRNKEEIYDVRIHAAEGLGNMRDLRAIEPLIETLHDDTMDGDMRPIEKVLELLTGQAFGLEYWKWQEWWEQHKKENSNVI